ncbi:transcription elongation factor, mitochondrial, partial [Mantella aurantiaca]
GVHPQQVEVILRLLNSASRSQLECVKELQGKRAAGIICHREESGPFPDLTTLCQHLHPSPIYPLCDSILTYTARNQHKALAQFIKPNVPLCRLQAVESVVCLVFGLRRMAWAHMDRTMTLRDWQQRQCFHFMKGKYMPDLYLEDIGSVVSLLPAADLFILERPSLSSQSSAMFPVMLHLRTVEAMLYCLLSAGMSQEAEPRVFSMLRNTVGKHFDLMLGESRTSGVDVVQRLVDEAEGSHDPRVTFPPELIQQYRNQFQANGQNRHEEMCDALLLALTFYDLARF